MVFLVIPREKNLPFSVCTVFVRHKTRGKCAIKQCVFVEGIDSAGRYFTDEDVDLRLSPSDAKFVDTIHTDGDFLGTPQDHGHIDFHVNGGKSQPPGCSEVPVVGKRHKLGEEKSRLCFKEYICVRVFVVIFQFVNANMYPFVSQSRKPWRQSLSREMVEGCTIPMDIPILPQLSSFSLSEQRGTWQSRQWYWRHKPIIFS